MIAPREDVEEAPDLFGEIAVTWEDVRLWLAHVAGIDPDSWRALCYLRAWNVADKIRHAKARGEWPPLTRCDSPATTA